MNIYIYIICVCTYKHTYMSTLPPNLGEEIIDDPNAAVTIKPVNLFSYIYIGISLSLSIYISVYICNTYI